KTVDALAAEFEGAKIDAVVGIEARGFIFAPALAYHLGAGFVPVRKPKKLPSERACLVRSGVRTGHPGDSPGRDHESPPRHYRRRFVGYGRHGKGRSRLSRESRRQSGGIGIRGGA